MDYSQKIIVQLLDSHTQNELAEILGDYQSNISAYKNGTRKVTLPIKKKLHQKFGYDLDKLINDDSSDPQPFTEFINDVPEPEKIDNTDKAQEIINRKKPKDGVTPRPVDGYMMVEYQDLSVAAGVMGGANPDLLPEYKTRLVPHEFEKGNYLVVRVDGDSMDNGGKESIPDGCEVLIKEFVYEQGQPLPLRGNLFVIVTREGTVLKQIIKHDTVNEVLTLHSYNPKYKDYTVDMEDVLQIFIYRKITNYRPIIPDISQ